MPPLWYAGAFDYGRTKSMQFVDNFVDNFWDIANLFASQASYDASPSAGKTLLTQAVATALGWTNTGGLNGTYIGSDGNIATKTSGNNLRITFDRGAGQNRIAWSEDLSNAIWSKSNATATATKIAETAVTNSHYVAQDFTVTSGATYYLSAVCSAAERGYVAIFDWRTAKGTFFDLVNGRVLGNLAGAPNASGIIPLGGGQYRCWIQITTASANLGLQFYISTDGSTYNYAGVAGSGVNVTQVSVSPTLTYLRTFATALTTAGTPRSQNLVPYSADLTNAQWSSPWTAVSVTATRITSANATGFHYRSIAGPSWFPADGLARTAVYIVKSGTNDWAFFGFPNDDFLTYFNVVTGAFGTIASGVSASATANTDGSYTVRLKAAQSGATRQLSVGLAASSGVALFAGTGAEYIDVLGVQMYEGTADLPYVATTGTAYSEYPQAGLLREVGRTNLALWNRDLTNAAWTASSVTVAKTATGIDGVANSASTLTASGANGTVLQAITSASAARITSAYVRRKTGTGAINMTQDNGTTWTVITPQAYWSQIPIPSATAANPTIGFRIVTSGDAIEVDYVQHELGAFVTSPIGTTTAAVARDADLIRPPTTWINDTAQTTLMEFVVTKVGGTQQLMGRAGNGNIAYIGGYGAPAMSDGTVAVALASTVSDGIAARVATRYSAAGQGISLNGGAVSTGAFDGSMGTSASAVGLGDDGAGGNGFSGLLTRISIASRAANDADLQAASAGLK